jgi:hypothetical protein
MHILLAFCPGQVQKAWSQVREPFWFDSLVPWSPLHPIAVLFWDPEQLGAWADGDSSLETTLHLPELLGEAEPMSYRVIWSCLWGQVPVLD